MKGSQKTNMRAPEIPETRMRKQIIFRNYAHPINQTKAELGDPHPGLSLSYQGYIALIVHEIILILSAYELDCIEVYAHIARFTMIGAIPANFSLIANEYTLTIAIENGELQLGHITLPAHTVDIIPAVTIRRKRIRDKRLAAIVVHYSQRGVLAAIGICHRYGVVAASNTDQFVRILTGIPTISIRGDTSIDQRSCMAVIIQAIAGNRRPGSGNSQLRRADDSDRRVLLATLCIGNVEGVAACAKCFEAA